VKLNSFLAGGLIGAAVVYMMNGRLRGKLMSQMGNMWSGANMSQTQTSPLSGMSQSHGSHAAGEMDGLKKVKQMIASDPDLRKTIREIAGQSAAEQATSAVPKL